MGDIFTLREEQNKPLRVFLFLWTSSDSPDLLLQEFKHFGKSSLAVRQKFDRKSQVLVTGLKW